MTGVQTCALPIWCVLRAIPCHHLVGETGNYSRGHFVKGKGLLPFPAARKAVTFEKRFKAAPQLLGDARGPAGRALLLLLRAAQEMHFILTWCTTNARECGQDRLILVLIAIQVTELLIQNGLEKRTWLGFRQSV